LPFLLQKIPHALSSVKTTRKSAPFRAGVFPRLSGPYPSDYRTAFAFSGLSYPQRHQPSLRLALPPKWRRYGLTVFRILDDNGLGFRLSPGGLSVRVPLQVRRASSRLPFGSGRQHLGPVVIYEGFIDLLTLTLTIKPSSRSALMLADPDVASRLHPDFRRVSLSWQLHTPQLPATHVPVGYR